MENVCCPSRVEGEDMKNKTKQHPQCRESPAPKCQGQRMDLYIREKQVWTKLQTKTSLEHSRTMVYWNTRNTHPDARIKLVPSCSLFFPSPFRHASPQIIRRRRPRSGQESVALLLFEGSGDEVDPWMQWVPEFLVPFVAILQFFFCKARTTDLIRFSQSRSLTMYARHSRDL